jgi:long-chain acyl-CoA synthetase
MSGSVSASYDGPSDVVACLIRSITRRPGHCAIMFGAHRLSFLELGWAVHRCMEILCDVTIGTGLVGLHLSRTPEYVIAYLALAGLGATIAPFDDDTPDAEIAAEARALSLDTIVSNRDLAGIDGRAVIRVEATDPRGGAIPWVVPGLESGPDSRRLPRPGRVCPDTPLVLLRTSGSTSRPRRVLLRHRNALASSRAHRASVSHGPDEVSLVALPMSFGYCHTTQLIAQVDAGGTLTLLPGTFLPRTFGEAVATAEATTTTLVPSMLTLLARSLSQARSGAELSSLRSIVFGGAPVEPEILDSLCTRLPHVELIQTYGQTEAGPRIATLRAADARHRHGSVGRAVPGMRIVVQSATGEPLQPGQVGEIVVKGDGVMSSYFRDPAATAAVLRDGWLRTGDLGRLDDEGFLWLAGRLRNLIITAGRNVIAEEVEAYLRQVPGVADAAVVGEPDELRGESVHALVVRCAGAAPSARDVRAFLAPRLDRYKLPRRVTFVARLPRTPNGKIDRPRLGLLAAKETT